MQALEGVQRGRQTREGTSGRRHERAGRSRILVTSGQFTPEAVQFADRNARLELVDGAHLAELIESLQSAQSSSVLPQAASQIPAPTPAVPPCPQCGRGMVRRTARRGPGAGEQFWGCSRYPKLAWNEVVCPTNDIIPPPKLTTLLTNPATPRATTLLPQITVYGLRITNYGLHPFPPLLFSSLPSSAPSLSPLPPARTPQNPRQPPRRRKNLQLISLAT